MKRDLELQTLTEKFELPTTHIELFGKVEAMAISVAWDMLTLVPPAILCMPEKFSETWHEVVGKPCVKGAHYRLSYYRPLMLYHAHGTVAVRAIVSKEPSYESTVNMEDDSDEGW